MKILIIRNFPVTSNLKKITYNLQELGLARALTRKGHEVDLLFWTKDNEEIKKINIDDTEISVFYKKGLSILKNVWFKDVNSLIEKYDVIQCCEYNQIMSWHFAKKFKDKLVIYHGPYYSKFNFKYNLICFIFDLFFVRRYKKYNTKFIVKSVLAKDFLINKHLSNENITIAGVGLDTESLNGSNECKYPILESIYKDDSNIKLLYIGKIEKRRNPYFLIDLVENLKNQNFKVKLYIVGNGTEKYLNAFSNYIKSKCLGNNIIWLKQCEQIYLHHLYENVDYFLLPTSYEIFGMVLLEAMYFGCKVITTMNGGSTTIIKNEVNGYLTSNLDISEWSNIIVTNLNDKKTGINAEQTIKNHYTWNKLVYKFIKVYEEKIDK